MNLTREQHRTNRICFYADSLGVIGTRNHVFVCSKTQDTEPIKADIVTSSSYVNVYAMADSDVEEG